MDDEGGGLCYLCGGTGVIDWGGEWKACACEAGRKAGPLIAADQRKDVDKADEADEI